jgi:integrase
MRYMSIAQVKALLSAIPDDRNRLMVLVAFNHALRVSEVTNLTGRDIQDGHVSVQRLKGSMKTIQPFVASPDPLLDESVRLAELARTVGRTERLFPMTRNGVYKLIQRAGKVAGLPEHLLFPHALKHSAAMAVIGQGIEFTRQYLGHVSIASTGAYVQVSDQDASAAFQRAMLQHSAVNVAAA